MMKKVRMVNFLTSTVIKEYKKLIAVGNGKIVKLLSVV
jgi:hypothetical protein